MVDIKKLLESASSVVEEHHEFSQNDNFNTLLDEGSLGDYELILKKPDGTEQYLEPISKCLFYTDRSTYRTLLLENKESMKNSTLCINDYPSNADAFDKLLSTVKSNGTVIPFVGAGFSVAAGCPSWSNYILSQATKAGLDEVLIKAKLDNGEHEQVMTDVIAAQTLPVFRRDFTSSFKGRRIAPALSPATEMIALFDGSMITTNFDCVLEDSHAVMTPFKEKVVGTENTGRFMKSIYCGDKYLLKLHGNIDDDRNRILTRDEYDLGYGSGTFNWSLPIPRTLLKVFSGFTVLFLGCSLIADRYLGILKHIYDTELDFMPDHFAILPAPNDHDELLRRDQFLASHGINPIWYPDGDWDKPSEILKLLKSEI